MSKKENQLPKGWEIKKLGEVCDFQNGFAFQSKLYKESGFPILRITNIQNDEINTKDLVYFNLKDCKVNLDRFKVFQGDLLIAMSGATTGKLGINHSETVFYLNQRVGKFMPKKHLSRIFLYYFLKTKVEESLRIAAGAAQPNLSTEQIYSFEIPLPPLPEQQRIVSILDEAFAAIAKAKANAEQNLKNAKELFESYLQGVFEKKGEGWEERKLGEVVEIVNGKNQSQVISDAGKYPIYGSAANLMGYATDFLCKEGTTIIGRKGNISKPIYINEKFWNVDTAFGIYPKNGYDTKYIYYLCLTINFKSRNRGTTIPSLVKSDLLNIDVLFSSSVKEQQTIVSQLDALRAETQKLEAIYKKKLTDLEELKKSVLQKAFSGEL